MTLPDRLRAAGPAPGAFLATCAIALASACATRATDAASQQTPVPVLDSSFADPFVLPVGRGLVAYATNRTEADGSRTHVPVSTSRDGLHWSDPREAMPTPPPWARRERPDIWAPEAIRVGQRYLLYFSARHASRMRPDGLTLCIGAAVADAPTGPFVPQRQPLTCGGVQGVIDASPFRDRDADGRERLWLVYKTDGNCCGVATGFIAQPLRDDGLGFAGAPRPVAGIGNDRPWEGGVVEAPQLLRAHGALWLFYAGNDYGGGAYATGYARCDSPSGPCVDAPENPILRSGPGLVGPGHPTLFAHAGRTWIAYHGWRPATGGRPRYRAMYVQPLDWRDGRPVPAR